VILSVPIKLLTTSLQHQTLVETLRVANECSNYVAHLAHQTKTFGRVALQHQFYKSLRDQFPELNAQMILKCIAKASQSAMRNKKVQVVFKPTGAISYDQRILLLRNEKQFITLSSILGRLRIDYIAGEHQKHHLQYYDHSECKLVLRNNQFYLYCICKLPDATPIKTKGFLGVDLGIVNIATTSEGTRYSGSHLNNLRKRHNRLRAKLQSKGTRSAKRLLRKRKRRESRMTRNINHQISKHLVAKAKRTKSVIVLENLSGIRNDLRTRVKGSANATLSPQRSNPIVAVHSWSFYQLKTFIKYKAILAGVEVMEVNPHHTSQTCPECGYVSKRNRVSQSQFCCKKCGHAGHADYIAAINIASRGSIACGAPVNEPYAAVI
jgi:putative transposase